MNKSMTGYGQARFEDDQYAIKCRGKNPKQQISGCKYALPKAFNDKELEIRNIISDQLERGKVSLIIEFLNKKEATLQSQYQ
jgi:uncharacterized protein YicC (UPF0701 family)